ncbi:pyridoxamine 5-phosphate oxidase [Deltaproteobacteria bacterium Smac51]|nr:pyridoxamine 5-phosphate oxidase [Deltaproteobacteria bacterium Smac51]
MFDFAKAFSENPNGVLATVDGDQIKTRVFQYLFTENGRAHFCTSREKDVFKQLTANPQAAFCAFAPDYSPVVSINGKAVFVEDAALKTRILNENPMINGIYKSPDNPVFAVFYIEPLAVETFSFADGPNKYKP